MLKLDINLLWTVVNVLIMYALLRKFLFKPVQDVIAKRQQMVDANLADAETSKKEAAETMNAAQEKLRNVDNEAAARREAYEKQASFLIAQSRAMGTLMSLIKQYDELCRSSLATDEQRLRIEKLKTEIAKTRESDNPAKVEIVDNVPNMEVETSANKFK